MRSPPVGIPDPVALSTPPPQSPSRIPSLDGLRAISIALVVVGHLFNGLYNRRPSTAEPLWLVFGNGALGVSVFFVISGFLITRLLVRERERTGTIRLRDFYVRRFLRLFPAFYAYVAFVALASLAGVLTLSHHDLLSALTYTWNYWPGDSWALAHIWSLSMEEQFYILWPGLVFLLVEGTPRLALALILLAPFSRVATALLLPGARLDVLLHTRVDNLMFGCLAGLLYDRPFTVLLRRRYSGWLAPVALCLLVLTPFLTARFGGAYLNLVGYTLEGGSITILMLWAVEHSGSPAGRLLNWSPFVLVGVMSYSIYLWQTFFLDGRNPLRLAHFPLNLLAIAVAATVSYYGVERPLLRWRDRRVRARSHAA